MTPVDIGKQAPANYKALVALHSAAEQEAAAAGLDPLLVELVKIRASQINGCAFCLRMHSRDAIEKGETADRLAVLAAWWESQYFSPQEREALHLAEQITTTNAPVPPRDDVESVLDSAQIVAITWLSIVINAWNRVAIASHYPVSP